MKSAKTKIMRFRGFTLLEIMVALALMALSFTALFLVQSRATDLANRARSLSIATQLARLQLVECKREAQKIIASASDFKMEGDFRELGNEQYTWECHAPKFNMKTPSASQVEKTAKNKAPDAQKQGMATTQSAVSPVLSLITDTLSNSVRELAVIVRWNDGNAAEELRVVTHVVDLAAMNVLTTMLREGVKTLDKMGTKGDAVQPATPKSKAQPGQQ